MDKQEIRKLLEFISKKEEVSKLFIEALGGSGETIVRAYSYSERDNFLHMYNFLNYESRDKLAECISNAIL